MSGAKRPFQSGDPVVFCKVKRTTHPGRRAKHISPDAHGDAYVYCVDKYWRVVDVDEQHIHLVTRTGKRLTLDAGNPNLRRPNLRERLLLGSRFPAPDVADTGVRPA